jgi:hypothetical protein
MTAESFADLVNARRAGAGKWQARCPAHDDRRPSLSISQGHSGILLKCWSHGCTPGQIATALGLPMSALFAGPPPSPQQAAALLVERHAKAALAREQRESDRAIRDRIYKLGQIVDALGAKLARSPDDRELGSLFHCACDRLHDTETTESEKRLAVNEPPERTV